ncbi:MAG: hypothetical protein GY777_10455, partial [Candidatus Brocadiaceae bacterium]|nr:hypothetical protein [Candidatus Brocadiaceae bacterium]
MISVCGLLRTEDLVDLPESDFPVKKYLNLDEKIGKFWQNGGTVIADPKGNFVSDPLVGKEGIVY